jgi:hypothetical protein
MLCKRITPRLDIKVGRVFKEVSFVSLRDAGDPLEVAKRYNEQPADRFCALAGVARPVVACNRRRGRELRKPLGGITPTGRSIIGGSASTVCGDSMDTHQPPNWA